MNTTTHGREEGDIERELRLAHQIIKNALNIMTPAQKSKWASMNERTGCNGEGITRANERERLLSNSGTTSQ